MVGVHMSADDALDRLACHEALKQGLPARFGRIEVEAGIDDRPAVAIL